MLLESYLTALSRVFVEMLIVVMLVQFIGHRQGSGKLLYSVYKSRCGPYSGPVRPTTYTLVL